MHQEPDDLGIPLRSVVQDELGRRLPLPGMLCDDVVDEGDFGSGVVESAGAAGEERLLQMVDSDVLVLHAVLHRPSAELTASSCLGAVLHRRPERLVESEAASGTPGEALGEQLLGSFEAGLPEVVKVDAFPGLLADAVDATQMSHQGSPSPGGEEAALLVAVTTAEEIEAVVDLGTQRRIPQ